MVQQTVNISSFKDQKSNQSGARRVEASYSLYRMSLRKFNQICQLLNNFGLDQYEMRDGTKRTKSFLS